MAAIDTVSGTRSVTPMAGHVLAAAPLARHWIAGRWRDSALHQESVDPGDLRPGVIASHAASDGR